MSTCLPSLWLRGRGSRSPPLSSHLSPDTISTIWPLLLLLLLLLPQTSAFTMQFKESVSLEAFLARQQAEFDSVMIALAEQTSLLGGHM